jgi:hypothetical protein
MNNVENKETSRSIIIPSPKTLRKELYRTPDTDMKYVRMSLILFINKSGTRYGDTFLYPSLCCIILWTPAIEVFSYAAVC